MGTGGRSGTNRLYRAVERADRRRIRPGDVGRHGDLVQTQRCHQAQGRDEARLAIRTALGFGWLRCFFRGAGARSSAGDSGRGSSVPRIAPALVGVHGSVHRGGARGDSVRKITVALGRPRAARGTAPGGRPATWRQPVRGASGGCSRRDDAACQTVRLGGGLRERSVLDRARRPIGLGGTTVRKAGSRLSEGEGWRAGSPSRIYPGRV